MDEIRLSLFFLARQHQPVTIRQLFYLAVSAGVVDKTEAEYKGTVCRLAGELRKEGIWHEERATRVRLPYEWIADNTRWMRKPTTWGSVEEALASTARFYRRRLWAEQDEYVEVWCEKDSVAGVLYDVTEEWDLPLMVCRGYPSLTFVYSAANAIADETVDGRRCTILYVGDHDPSGVDIQRDVTDKLHGFAGDAEIDVRRIAVTPKQITEYGLPTRPTKRTDSRAATFAGESVEVEALPPDALRRLLTAAVEALVDPDQLQVTHAAEESERDLLQKIANRKWAI